MKINNDDLKHIYKANIQDRVPFSREKCPSAEKIWRLFSDRSPRRFRKKIIDHITDCSYCAQEFALFLAISRQGQKLEDELGHVLEQGEREQLSQKKTMRHFFKRPLFWKYAFIPLLTLSIMSLVLVIDRSILNKKRDERGVTQGQIRLISPSYDKAAHFPLVFSWTEMKNRDCFVVEIFDDSLMLIWRSPRIFSDYYELPFNAAQKIRKGKSYYWMITAFLKDGMKIESQLQEFTMAEKLF